MIQIDIREKQIHLSNDYNSYVIAIHQGKLIHQYFGPRLTYIDDWIPKPPCSRSFRTEHEGFSSLAFDEIPFEFPEDNQGDYRQEAVSVGNENRYILSLDFQYRSCRIHNRVEKPEGLPGVRAGQEGKTLEVIIEDSRHNLRVSLFYGLLDNVPGILRWNQIQNLSEHSIYIEKLASFSLDLPDRNQELVHIAGSHLAEGQVCRDALTPGVHRLESRRGVSSSQHPPFAALADPNTNAFQGNILSAQLFYSGNHEFVIQKEYPGGLRFTGSLNPWRFSWKLPAGSSFAAPEAVLMITSGGLNGMAQAWHDFYLSHILRNPGLRPEILLNSWEAMYYQTTQEKLDLQMNEAARLGIECYVVDDGWFRMENNSRAPIGDWEVCKEKLPQGLKPAAHQAEKLNMRMGLWLEPEAVSQNSRLFREHPEWVLKVPHKDPVTGRHELLLNLGLREVQNHLISMVDTIIRDTGITYIKWDMNRPLTDLPDEETVHRYVLGLYRVLDSIRTLHPSVRLEGCSSGGSRLDGGMFCYVDQNWTSDNTDPFDRLHIQQGLALMFPPQVLTAHISASPNHQTGRTSSLNTRFQLCRFFNPGYELDLKVLSSQEKDAVQKQITQFQNEREWMHRARFYAHDEPMWSKYDPFSDQAEILVFQEHINRMTSHARFRIPYLPEDHLYELQPEGRIYTGRELAWSGFEIQLEPEDFHVYTYSLKPVQFINLS